MTGKMRAPEQVYQELKELPPDLFDFPFGPELCDRLKDEISTVPIGLKGQEEPLLGALTFYGRGLVESGLPERISEIVFGDKTLVFDVSDRIRGEAFVGDALSGSPPGFDPPERETLSAFIRRCRCGVVVFENLQAFDVRAIDTLAGICDTGEAYAHGASDSEVPADRIIVVATAAVRLPSINELAAANLKLDNAADKHILQRQNEFTDALWHDVSRRYPDHLRPWVYARFRHRLEEHIWQRFRELLADRRLDEPLFDYVRPETQVWRTGSEPPPMIDRREIIDDVRTILESVTEKSDNQPPSSQTDVFISCRTARNAQDAEWLAAKLREEGLTVWLDKDSLAIAPDADLNRKADLIRKLVSAVRSARCTIAFAASMQPFRLPDGYTEEDALRRGIAMRQDDILIAWNWQKLEIDHAADVLIIDTSINSMYIIQEGQVNKSFGYRRYADTGDMWRIIAEYLRRIALLGEP